MIDFDQAVKIAEENATKLVKNARNFVLEGALISEDNQLFEVTLSYDIERPESPLLDEPVLGANLAALAKLMGKRREYKVFMVDASNGQFRGFKNSKEA